MTVDQGSTRCSNAKNPLRKWGRLALTESLTFIGNKSPPKKEHDDHQLS